MRSLLVLIALRAVAAASPITDLDVDNADTRIVRKLVHATADPGGLEVPADGDPAWAKLGLRAGDVIRFENGRAVGGSLHLYNGRFLLEIDRGGTPLLLRLHSRSDRRRESKLTVDDRRELVERVHGNRELAAPLASHGRASGVRLLDMQIAMPLSLEVGDVVMTFGRDPIRSEAELVAAIEGLRPGVVEIGIERDGRQLAIAVTVVAPLEVSKIRRVSETQVVVPAAIRDALKADVLMFTNHVRLLPATSGARVHGWKLLEIPADGLYAALGFHDEDVVVDVEGRSIDRLEEAIAVHTDLEPATSITVHVLRRGKPLAIVYTIAD